MNNRHHPDSWEEAQGAVDAIRTALAEHGIVLPELGIDATGVVAGYPMVRLGDAPADTVHQMAAALSGRR
jgi:hypothetical protein